MSPAFPTWTAVAGVVGAALITGLGVVLRRRLATRDDPAGARAADLGTRWQPGDVAALLLVIALALLGRLVGLESRPVDNDEPVGLLLGTLGEWATSDDARLHPPLPGVLMAIAGGAGDLVRARELSALAGIGVVALAFAVTRQAAGRGPALIAGVWLALAPAMLHVSQLARGYALLAAFVLAAHFCLSRALRSGRERWWLGYSALVAAALASEYLALAPLAAEAMVAIWLERRRPQALLGLVGSFGAALTLVAFLVPFAVPTLRLGVGGGPHPPTGVARSASELLSVLSGAAAPYNGLLGLALVVVAAARGKLDRSQARLAAAFGAVVALVLFGATMTTVRPRYALHAVPLLVPLVVIAAVRLARGSGALVASACAAGHLVLLPCYCRGTCSSPEISTGRPTPAIFERLSREPGAPVAVVPEWAVAEPSWRLAQAFPGRDAGLDCPVELCVRGARRVFGSRVESLPALRAREPHLFVIDRWGTLREPAGCGLIMREGPTVLWLCEAGLESPP